MPTSPNNRSGRSTSGKRGPLLEGYHQLTIPPIDVNCVKKEATRALVHHRATPLLRATVAIERSGSHRANFVGKQIIEPRVTETGQISAFRECSRPDCLVNCVVIVDASESVVSEVIINPLGLDAECYDETVRKAWAGPHIPSGGGDPVIAVPGETA